MKSVKKFVLFLIAIVMMLSLPKNLSYAESVYCFSSPDRYHHYDGHRSLNYGYSEAIGTHSYIAYYEDGVPVYGENCMMYQVYYYCERFCIFCNGRLEGSIHSEEDYVSHSVLHH